MQKVSSTRPRSRGQQPGAADPEESAGFQLVEMDPVEGASPFLVPCPPDDFALEVLAPASAIREALPQTCGPAATAFLRARWWDAGSAANSPNLIVRLPPQLPGMPKPVPPAVFAQEPKSGLVYQLVAWLGQPGWHRWAALAACFIVIATAANSLVFRRTEQASASATQAPASSVEDFTAGFSRWEGAEGGGKKPWTLEVGRGAIPNSLALFKPSKGMTSYRLEFSADVMKNGISWVVRASDLLNYEALQITERKRGNDLQLWLTRYKVVAGKEEPRTQIPLQVMLPPKSLWLVRLETIGDNSTLWIENQIANSWSQAGSVPGGSIGFFAGKGDQYMLRKVRITPE